MELLKPAEWLLKEDSFGMLVGKMLYLVAGYGYQVHGTYEDG